MAVWAEIATSQVEYGRFDAQFYRPEFLELKRVMEASGYMLHRLGSLAEKIDVGYVGPMTTEYRQEGIVLLRSQNIKEFQVDIDRNPIFIPEAFHQKLHKSEVHPGDILITRSGVAGNAAIVPHCFPTANSADIILVRLHTGINIYYVTAFINSRFGRFQIERQVSGGVQGHLNLTIAEDILIPDLRTEQQSEISEIVRVGLDYLAEAKLLYVAAERLLEEELGLDKIDLSSCIGYEARLSETFHARRWDAQHYCPKYEVLMEVIRKAPDHRPLGEMITYNQRGLQPKYVSDGSIAVVNSQHIGPQHLAYDSLERSSESAFESGVRARILKNDILVYTTGAYVGRTNIFLQEIRALASNHVNIIRLQPEYDPAYVAVVMNSQVGLLQTEKHVTGSTQAELYPSAIAKFAIPILASNTMSAIGDKVRASYGLLNKANGLLERAKRRVEEFIEQGAKGIRIQSD